MELVSIKNDSSSRKGIVYKLSCFFFIISCLTLQFYVFASGTLQPSQFFLIAAFILLIIFNGIDLNVIKNKAFFYFIVFILLTIVINTIYSIMFNSIEFIVSSLYYLFGIFFTYTTILLLTKNDGLNDYLVYILTISLVILITVWALGFGDYKFFPRYNGYFNDPNQMAHWALCIVSTILILSANKRLHVFVFIAGALVVLASLSRSGFLGLTLIGIGIIIKINKTFLVSLLILIIVLFSTLTIDSDNSLLSSYENITNRLLETDLEEQADTRGYTRIQNYPQYLILGAGQGLDYRFNSDYEIHSSWAGLLFYYGIFTTLLFLNALFVNIRKFSIPNIFISLGPLFYGFSTFGIRTPVFWLFIGVVIYTTNTKYRLRT